MSTTVAEEVPQRGEVAGPVAQLLDHRWEPQQEQHADAAPDDGGPPQPPSARLRAPADRRSTRTTAHTSADEHERRVPTWHCTTKVPAANAPRLPATGRPATTPHTSTRNRTKAGSAAYGFQACVNCPRWSRPDVREAEGGEHQEHERGAGRGGTPAHASSRTIAIPCTSAAPTSVAHGAPPVRLRQRREGVEESGPGWLKPRLYAPTSGVFDVNTSRTRDRCSRGSCTGKYERPTPRHQHRGDGEEHDHEHEHAQHEVGA